MRELLRVVSSYLQQCANLEADLDSMIAHVSLEHVTQFVSLAIMQGSQDDLMNIVPSYYVCSTCISFFYNLCMYIYVYSSNVYIYTARLWLYEIVMPRMMTSVLVMQLWSHVISWHNLFYDRICTGKKGGIGGGGRVSAQGAVHMAAEYTCHYNFIR